ncbi:MAG TPA: glycosyltransferase [Vicinamibacterales bacterium]|nr:glycosyltransferase [Vicinamibacterales bacterium]
MVTSRSPRPRALFVAYTFPPVGGAGVQRTTKFVKYLPYAGWDASVLTVSNPSVPVRDVSLCGDVPSSTTVVRARTFEPSYATKTALMNGGSGSPGSRRLKHALHRAVVALLQPDPQILWSVPAFVAGMRALRRTRHDAIVATAPPFSSLLLGAALSRVSNVPLVLDYRDEWGVSNMHWENRQLRGESMALQRAMEKSALRRADAVVATSPRSALELKALIQEAGASAPVTHIFNGFDPEDFPGDPAYPRPRSSSRRWRLVYTGTLYNLMSPEPLVQAVEMLAASRPDLAAQIDLVFAGRRAAEQARRLERIAGLCRLETHEYVSHGEAIAMMRSADALCLLLSDLPGADRVIPAKLFEYIASRRPILTIAPPGDVWDLLQAHPSAFTRTPRDVRGISEWLARAIDGGVGAVAATEADTRAYNRRYQAERLASLLDALVAAKPRGRRRVDREAA